MKDHSPAMPVYIGSPIRGLLRSTKSVFAVFSDWWLTTNAGWMAAHPSTNWNLVQISLRRRFWMDYPDLRGDPITDDCLLFSEKRRFFIPPPVGFYSPWTEAQGAIFEEPQSQTHSPASICSPNLDSESLQRASLRNASLFENSQPQYEYSAPPMPSNAFLMDSAWPDEAPWESQQGSDWQASSSHASRSGLFRL